MSKTTYKTEINNRQVRLEITRYSARAMPELNFPGLDHVEIHYETTYGESFTGYKSTYFQPEGTLEQIVEACAKYVPVKENQEQLCLF